MFSISYSVVKQKGDHFTTRRKGYTDLFDVHMECENCINTGLKNVELFL